MSHDPLDTVIGLDESKRDAARAREHLTAARKAADAGDRATQISLLRQAVAADPLNTTALFDLAYRLDLLGEEDEAMALYERACDTPPAPINVLINLAVLYEDRGDYSRAERCLRQVLETRPNHPRARLYMQDVLAGRDVTVEDDDSRDLLKRRALYDTPVTDFDLSVRARTCLKKMRIQTLGDLLRVTEVELTSSKNFGEASLTEIKSMLSARGLRLGQGLEDSRHQSRRRDTDPSKGPARDAVLNKPVTELQLSVRARKALQLLNIRTLGELAEHTEAQLMGVKNFGQTSLVEVRERLAEFGLSLRTLEG